MLYGKILHGQMLHGQMLHRQMLHGQMLHGQMLHGQMVLGHLSTVKDGSTNLKCPPRYFPWHTWPIFDVWSALFKQGGILHICIDDQAPFYRNG